MTVVKVYVFSENKDSFYVKHLEEVNAVHDDLTIRFRIGDQYNFDSDEICSLDTRNHNSILIKSYSFVPNYSKVNDTFFWVNPMFNIVVLGDKFIAIPSKIDTETNNRILRQFISPKLDNDFLSKSASEDVKNYAKCSSRFSATIG